MGRRLFNGNRFSENGWPYVDEAGCTWTKIPGCNGVSLQIQSGLPLQIIRAWVADWNAYVESVRDRDTCCFTLGNSVSTSNHPGGTAVDICWDSHPFRVWAQPNVGGCGFSAQQISTIEQMLEFYEGTMFWANNWNTPKDAMHSQLGYDTYDQNNDRPKPWVAEFVARKIRADGFSTFRRGNAPVSDDPAIILANATGISLQKSQEILPMVSEGLVKSKCNTVRRIAFWLAQIGHESDRFNATEEYANGDVSTDRWRYKGRTWIQITWSTNYAGFSRWCFAQGLVPVDNYFVQNPRELAELRWAGLGAAWYWTVQRPRINELCDNDDFDDVTYAINGGQNGASDRRALRDLALRQGDKLLSLLNLAGGDDFMATVSREEWDALVQKVNDIHHESTEQVFSLSPYRRKGEGTIGNIRQVQRNDDLMDHVKYVEDSAVNKHDLDSIDRVVIAANGLGEDQSPSFIARARGVLKDIESKNSEAFKAYLQTKGVQI